MLRSTLASLLVALLLSACGGATRGVRTETTRGHSAHSLPRGGYASVELGADEFQGAVARMARDIQPTPRPLESARRQFGAPSIAVVSPAPRMEDPELTRAYLRWCERTLRAGDCLRLLVDGPRLSSDGKYALAMAIAHGSVLGETQEAFRALADPRAVVATVVSTATFYMMLWVLPEPVSKGVATTMTVVLLGYLGYETVWGLISGWMSLVDEVDRATTFDELRAAGERYGKVMGQNAARLFVMLATAAAGQTGAQLAAKLPTLPGAAQAAVAAEARAGVLYGAVAQVQSVAITAEGLTLALAPGAVAMTAQDNAPVSHRAWRSSSGFKRAMGKAGQDQEWHHIVEQTPGNIQRFGPEALHNTWNVIRLNKSLHIRLSAFYSAIREGITGSATLTVRKWLSTQSYEDQRKFGLKAIEKISTGEWK